MRKFVVAAILVLLAVPAGAKIDIVPIDPVKAGIGGRPKASSAPHTDPVMVTGPDGKSMSLLEWATGFDEESRRCGDFLTRSEEGKCRHLFQKKWCVNLSSLHLTDRLPKSERPIGFDSWVAECRDLNDGIYWR